MNIFFLTDCKLIQYIGSYWIHMIHQSYPIVPSFQAVWGMILGHDPTLSRGKSHVDGLIPGYESLPDDVAGCGCDTLRPHKMSGIYTVPNYSSKHLGIWKSSLIRHSMKKSQLNHVKPNAINHPSALGVYDSIVGYSHQVLGEPHWIYPMCHHAHLIPASVFEEAWEQKKTVFALAESSWKDWGSMRQPIGKKKHWLKWL